MYVSVYVYIYIDTYEHRICAKERAIRARPIRVQGAHTGPGPSGPRGAHKGLARNGPAHTSPGGPEGPNEVPVQLSTAQGSKRNN